MLELKHISYSVQEANETLGILKDISLTIDDHKLGGVHRPQRRRQDHPGQDHHGPGDPHRRARSSGTARTLPT